ncbi:MAG: hypothetical protein R6V13_12555 [Anaerolineae bacterium]
MESGEGVHHAVVQLQFRNAKLPRDAAGPHPHGGGDLLVRGFRQALQGRPIRVLRGVSRIVDALQFADVLLDGVGHGFLPGW